MSDGRRIETDLVVVAVGIRPNIALARSAGVAINRGIVVDDRIETSVPGIYAIGECAEHRGQCYGLVEPAYEQARVLAARLADAKSHISRQRAFDQSEGLRRQCFLGGRFSRCGRHANRSCSPIRAVGTYKKLVIADDRLVGAVLFGDTADSLWYLDLIRSGRPISQFRNDLAFGRALAEHQAA